MEKLYRIRKKSDGLYSNGGSYPKFSKMGKFWRKQHLMSHLTLVSGKSFGIEAYKDCEIVQYRLVEEETDRDILLKFQKRLFEVM